MFMNDREEIQRRYNIRGGFVGTLFGAFCCGCCLLMQSQKELDYIKVNQQGPQMMPQGYTPQPQMVMAQPNMKDHEKAPPAYNYDP